MIHPSGNGLCSICSTPMGRRCPHCDFANCSTHFKPSRECELCNMKKEYDGVGPKPRPGPPRP